MKNFMRKSLMSIITLTLILSMLPLNAFAANYTPPYGYTWEDSSNGKMVYQYNEYDPDEDTYSVTKRVSSKGNYIYNANGDLIFSKSGGSGGQYIGFDEDGTLFVIANDGSVYASSNLKVFQQILKKSNKATYFKYNVDDLVISVKTKKGMLSISDFKLETEVLEEDQIQEEEVVVKKAKNRVDQTENSAGEMVYMAYKDGELYMKLVVGDSKVLNKTADVRLSDTLVGAKFLGIDTSYNVYMYETNGSLYRFKHGSWYSAQKIALSGNFRSCSRNDDGFITKISTTDKTYTIEQLTTDSKWKATRTYAVNKDSYATLYTKGSAKSNTLTLNDDSNLLLNGKLVAKNVDEFYFVNKSYFVYSKDTNLYKASLSNPTKATKVTSKFKDITLNDGLAKKAVLTSGKTLSLT